MKIGFVLDIKKKKVSYVHLFVCLALVALLVVFAFCDLRISNAFFDKNSLFGRIFKEIGEIPMWLIIPLFFLSAAFVQKNKSVKICLIIVFSATNYFWLRLLLGLFSFPSFAFYLVCLVFSILIVSCIFLAIFCALDRGSVNRLFVIFLIGALFAVLSLSCVHLLKAVWGRVRYVNLDGDFTDWYIVNGFNGNRSFPSGHTTAACGTLIVLAFIKEFKPRLFIKISLIAFACIFILATALSRIILGAHYASDVTFAMLICYLVYHFSEYIVYKYRKNIQ